MKKYLSVPLVIAVIILFAVPSMACDRSDCTHNNNYNSTSIGVGVGIGVADAKADAKANAQVGNITVSPLQERLIQAPEVNPIVAPLTQSDKFGTYKDLPLFANIAPLGQSEKVTKVLKVHDGGVFTSIRLEEIEQELLELADEYKDNSKVRYLIKYKMSVQSMGTGGGIAGSDVGMGAAGTASIVPYVGSSTVNPKFFLIIVEVK